MEYIELENILYEILDATYIYYYNDTKYISIPNTLRDKHHSAIIYNQALNDILYEEMLSWEHAKKISEKLGFWTSKNEAGLKELEQMLDDTKLQLFLNNTNPNTVLQLKKKIKQIRTGINRSNNNKHRLYHATKESYAENIKKEFLVATSLRDENYNILYNIDNFINVDHGLIQYIIEKTNHIDLGVIREISRSEPWRSMWVSQKGDVFGKPAVEWTEYQRILCSFSRMYDNVYESPECPPDDVIEDNDMLDGWFIKQKRDREKNKKEKMTDKMFGKHQGKGGNQELFLVANNRNEAQNIYNMNDDQSKSIVKSREQQIKSKGHIDHSELSDVQLGLKIQANQELRNNMRKR